jgi:hypothetical protein
VEIAKELEALAPVASHTMKSAQLRAAVMGRSCRPMFPSD